MAILVHESEGGTGKTSYTDGQLLIGDSTTNGLDKGTLTATGGAVVTLGHGTVNIDAAGSGVGTYADVIVPIASEVSINAAANVVTMSVPAGDWDVYGELWVDTLTGTVTVNGRTLASITTISATFATVPSSTTARASVMYVPITNSASSFVIPVGPVRVSGPATVFLVGACAVSAGTAFGYGKLSRRRWA